MQKEILNSLPKEYIDILERMARLSETNRVYCNFEKNRDGLIEGHCFIFANYNYNTDKGKKMYRLEMELGNYDDFVGKWYISNEIDNSCIVVYNNSPEYNGVGSYTRELIKTFEYFEVN